MDDVLKRALQTVGFVFGMMLFIYFLIATGSEKPAMLTLVYFNFMNRVFQAVWWFIQIAVMVSAIAGLAFIIYTIWKAKKDEVAEQELKRKQNLIREEEKRIWQEEKEMKQEETKRNARLEELKSQQLLLEKERYLKIRSAEEVNQDALKHFL